MSGNIPALPEPEKDAKEDADAADGKTPE